MATSERKHYQTKQRELIYACLCARPDEYLTARQVAKALDEQGVSVGMATVYRNLDRLASDGLVTKGSIEGNGGACYRLVRRRDEDGQGSAERERTCFYLKCEECGELTPIECRELEGFYEHFAEEHHVRIDPVKTVLYGTCAACLGAQEHAAGVDALGMGATGASAPGADMSGAGATDASKR